MSVSTPNANPFQTLLSQCLRETRGALTISLTDRRGDRIAIATVGESAGAPSQEALALVQVYGQLAYQRAPSELSEVSVVHGDKRWTGRELTIADDVYHLWIIGFTDPLSAATLPELERALDALEKKLHRLLNGHL